MQENNNGNKVVYRHAKEIGKSLYMSIVLFQGISEMVFVTVNVLRPLVAIIVAIYPTRIVLGLDDKNAIGRNHDMINLYGIAVPLYNNVVPNVIFIGKLLQNGEYSLLATLAAIFGLAWQQFCEVE